MAGRRKCSECRKWFRPGATAAGHQKTCCEKCRRERRSRLARKRRLADLEAYREEEKHRQRRHRAGVTSKAKGDAAPGSCHGAASGSRHGPALEPRHGPALEPRHGPPSEPRHGPASEPRHAPASRPCHGPASTRNHWESQVVLAEIVDKVLAVSRATLERELLKNIEQFTEKVAQPGGAGPVSRATFTR
jgi:hypothetical protein